jgi:hypothetical protein
VTLEEKVKSIAEIYVKRTPAKDVLRPFYERADRDLPKNLSIVLTGWRKSVQDKLDAEDAPTIALCNKHGVIEEGEPTRRRRSRK